MTQKFTTPCFIRKNTAELRKKLEELGYKRNSPNYTLNDDIIWAYQYPVNGFDTPSYTIADAFDIPFDKHSCLCGKFIDCGTNEDLFLAIAALREDTDYMQWFMNGKDWYLHENQIPFDVCHSMYEQYGSTSIFADYHKATVEEIMEHFKN